MRKINSEYKKYMQSTEILQIWLDLKSWTVENDIETIKMELQQFNVMIILMVVSQLKSP